MWIPKTRFLPIENIFKMNSYNGLWVPQSPSPTDSQMEYLAATFWIKILSTNYYKTWVSSKSISKNPYPRSQLYHPLTPHLAIIYLPQHRSSDSYLKPELWRPFLAFNFQLSCFCLLPSAGIAGVFHHAWLYFLKIYNFLKPEFFPSHLNISFHLSKNNNNKKKKDS